VVLAVALWVVLARTRPGLALRAVGASPAAARVGGRIAIGRVAAVTFLVSGALAALAGAAEVSGVTFALYERLSPGYGYSAIAVALLARLHPLAVVGTALLFGALEAGAAGLQRTAGIPSVTVYAIEALVILAVVAFERRVRRADAR
jgi:simple sugar transport system permease protein